MMKKKQLKAPNAAVVFYVQEGLGSASPLHALFWFWIMQIRYNTGTRVTMLGSTARLRNSCVIQLIFCTVKRQLTQQVRILNDTVSTTEVTCRRMRESL